MVTEQEIIHSGFTPTRHPQDNMLFESVSAEFARVFGDQLEGVTLFIYRRSEQTAPADGCEGKTLSFKNSQTGGFDYALGISVEAMEMGDDYAAGTMLHELSHMDISKQNNEHGELFKQCVSDHVRRYEQETGKDLSKYDVTGGAVQIRNTGGTN